MEPTLITPAYVGSAQVTTSSPAKGAAFLIHGLTATTAEVAPLARFLSERGYSSHAPLLPGHGTSLQELRKIPLIKILDSVAEKFEAFLETTTSAPIVIGESFGSLLAIWLAQRSPTRVGALGLLSLPLQFRSHMREKFLNSICSMPDIALNRLGYSKKRKRSYEKFQYPFISYDAHSIGAAARLVSLRKQILTQLPLLTCPVSVLFDPNDHHCVPEAISRFIEQIPSTEKEIHQVIGGEHELLVGPKSREIFDMLFAFIERVGN